ncbi:alpha,alpha-trehalose-phosphate synthase (UDP-forming) [Pantoea ananatis]|uniref:alpha,alpha-trehalose-phosphate synthase (UDP-forming) n=1 Tax=Pantoea ananas TaxID=553 RepID=UPI0015775BA0|nr:trehalose-6-phosphate synthase [Pantoea ananatis]NQE76215.1 trehalose-6-phosphate synthase [Pantoea ananatis]NQE80850.1 trehalose-6-phosphate synthase [Pantoea ananatis]PKC39054.1 trehalose-6-phosphate synthase [Pantoea ananatis 15320]
MSGLILVSHNHSQRSTLTAIYEGILAHQGGLWVSWDGQTAVLPLDTARPLSSQQKDHYETLTFPLTPGEANEGYHNYVHKGLWPVFHQRPDLARFSADGYREYKNINEAYARAICEHALPEDRIWIQDYHLLGCARYLREAGLTNPVGFFLHQPFPSGKMFEAIPDWRWLTESLLCCDVIGFQTVQDMNNFIVWLESEFRTERLAGDSFRVQGRIVRLGVFPVGIDLDDARCLRDSNSCAFMEMQCRENLPENTVLSGGHLDDSAGLPYRISAVEVLLRKHAVYQKNITLLQLAPPSAGYAHRAPEISQTLETLCGEFNGVHGMMNWYPVNCLTHAYSREEQAGIYRASRVALVTPLMAGMSLMAKMYVALQDPDNPGVLILSQFAGAAEQMDGAIIVNPYDPDAMADAIHSALLMPVRERRHLHARLMKGLHLHSSHRWSQAFLSMLSDQPVMPGPVVATAPSLRLNSSRARY